MKREHFLSPMLLLTGIAFLLVCCQQQRPPKEEEETSSEFDIQFKPFPPHELNKDATPEQLVSFAWNEFQQFPVLHVTLCLSLATSLIH